MMSPEHRPSFQPFLSATSSLSMASSRATIAALAVVLMAGTAAAQQPQATPPQQNSQPAGQPPGTGDRVAPGAVPQQGGAVPQTDRAPDLTLNDRQRDAVRKAVLARHTAQKPVPGFEPAAGAIAPRALKLESMPPEIVQDIPELRHFFVADIANRQVLVVNAMDRKIVAVIAVPEDTANAAAPAAGNGAAESAKDVKEATREQAAKDAAGDGEAAGKAGKPAGNDSKEGGSQAHTDRNKHYDDDANDPHIEKSVDQAQASDPAVLRDGVLTVPGAPKNSETAPAKFSAVNAALDSQPTMSGGVGLSPEQAAEVYRTIMADQAVPAADIAATEPAAQLPNLTPVHPWPDALRDKFPALATYGYIKTADKVLIVTPANKILVGWIDAQGQDPSSRAAEAAAAARGG
jgi:hypothetical protein